MADFASLNAALAALTAQVEETEGVAESAAALIAGFATAVQDAVAAALTADNSADDATLAAAAAAISTVAERFGASAAALGEAVVTNS